MGESIIAHSSVYRGGIDPSSLEIITYKEVNSQNATINFQNSHSLFFLFFAYSFKNNYGDKKISFSFANFVQVNTSATTHTLGSLSDGIYIKYSVYDTYIYLESQYTTQNRSISYAAIGF